MLHSCAWWSSVFGSYYPPDHAHLNESNVWFINRLKKTTSKWAFCMELNKATLSSNTQCSSSKLYDSTVWLNSTKFFTALRAPCFISAVLALRFCFVLSVHGSLGKLAYPKWDKCVEGSTLAVKSFFQEDYQFQQHVEVCNKLARLTVKCKL